VEPVLTRDWGLTIENRTSEETQELEEQILLLGSQFVPSSPSATRLNIGVGQTAVHISQEPLIRRLEVGAVAGASGARPPVLLRLQLQFLFRDRDTRPTSITVGRDVTDEVGVFTKILVVVGEGLLTRNILAEPDGIAFSAGVAGVQQAIVAGLQVLLLRLQVGRSAAIGSCGS
jgi:hypothetical protein